MNKINIEGLYDTGNAILTYSGMYVDVSNPDPGTFLIADIAHALSMQPRFGGHLKRFYSVAQHSIECSLRVPEEYQLQALLHDASEAYICDIPSPIKALLPDYKKLESKVMYAIAARFGFEMPLSESVKTIDKFMLEFEWSALVKKSCTIRFMDQDQAERIFLNLFETLCAK